MENKKLTWSEISNLYDREWVQLVDYDWEEEEDSLPRSGVVQAHAKTRREFDELIINNPQQDSVLLFVGKRSLPQGLVLSANHQQWKPASV